VLITAFLQTGVFSAGPYYPSDTIDTVPTAYEIFKAYEGMEGRKIQIKK
jgi:hypothetical protein